MSIWSLIIMAIYPALFLYGQNVNEISLGDIKNSAFVLLRMYTIIFAISFCIIKKFTRTVLFTAIVIVLCNYFAIFLKGAQFLFPSTKYWHVLSLVLLTCCVMENLVKIHIPQEGINIGILFLIIFTNLIFMVNMFPMISNNIVEKMATRRESIEPLKEERWTASDTPNIYYLIFDEYSSNEFMKKYYNYDNGELTDKLKEYGFNISLSSTNEAYMTKICMTNTLNLDYLFDMIDNDDKSKSEMIIEKRKNNLLFQILRERGYVITSIGNADFYGLEDASNAAAIEKATLDGRTCEQLVFQWTLLYPFVDDNSSLKAQSIEKNRNYINNKLEIVPNSGNFILFHVELPHTPFVFDEDGNLIEAENRLNWENKKYYLGQYIYASNMMEDIVSKIVEKDKDAVIVLTSDHSARGLDEFSDVDKCQIFNAVYFQGKPLDIEGLSGINTLRTLVNDLFGYEFEMIKTIPLQPAKE